MQGSEQPSLPGTQITASFSNDQVSGSAGCNNYSGMLTAEDGYFTVGPIITTRKMCSDPAGIMEQESAYLAPLEATGGFQWQQELVNNAFLVTTGQIFYTLSDGTTGVMNFVSSP